MNWEQIEQGFSSHFAKFFGIFDDFSNFYGTTYFEVYLNMLKYLAKNKETLCLTFFPLTLP